MNDIAINLFRLTQQLNDDFKGVIDYEDGLLLDLGLFTIVWMDKTKENFDWILPDIDRFKNIDGMFIDFLQELTRLGQEIEQMNPEFRGIFSELCFYRIGRVPSKIC